MSGAVIASPSGYADNKRATFAAGSQISCPDGHADDGTPNFAVTDAPVWATELFVQHRICGDWYACFSTGEKRYAVAIGATQSDAIRNAAVTA